MKVLVMVGAASSGKSTACQFLHDNGYSVLNESAETIIKQYNDNGKNSNRTVSGLKLLFKFFIILSASYSNRTVSGLKLP